MNNPNPFLPQSSFLEQKNKARARLRIVVLLSISLSAMVLLVLLVQGCRKNDTGPTADQNGGAPTPEATSNPTPDTNNGGPASVVTANNTGTVPPAPVEPSNTPPPPTLPPPAPPEPTTSDYTVVKGDTFSTIHTKFNVSVRAIEQANPGVDPKRLKIGQKLHIPAATSAAPSEASTTANAGSEGAAVSSGEQTYKVKSGDTLDGIHKKFHVSIKAIQSANDLKTTSIRVGQTLKIPSKPAAAPEPAPGETPAPPPAPTMPPPAPTPAPASNH